MGFRLGQIDHVELYVRDVEASVEWYRDILGLEIYMRFDPSPVMIGRGGTMLALFPAPEGAEPSEPSLGNYIRVAWRTDREGFIGAKRHLQDKRIEFRGPIDHEVSHSIYFKDPDGHPLEITYYF